MITKNFELLKGDTWDGLELHVSIQPALPAPSEPLPVLTTIVCQFRQDSKTGDLLKTITSLMGITVTDETTYSKVVIDSFDMDFQVGQVFYDMEFNMDGNIKTLIGGIITILQDVTNG